MNKFYKFAGLILLVVTVTLFTKSTEAKAYTYENWKDSVVNDDSVDMWENHYDIFASDESTIWDRAIHEKGKYNAEVLNLNVNKGNMIVLPCRNLLSKEVPSLQMITLNASGTVTYRSLNEKVCTVDQNGKVTIGTHTGATIVEATDSKGNRRGALILAVTGNSPQWFEDMFTRAYYGNDSASYSDIDEAVMIYNVYIEDAGNTGKIGLIEKVYEVISNKCRLKDDDTEVNYCFTYIAPFFNITGREGITSVNTSNITVRDDKIIGNMPGEAVKDILGYIDGQLFWLEDGEYRHIYENGGGIGNYNGFESGYTHVENNGWHTFRVANEDDCRVGTKNERKKEHTITWSNWVK